MGVEIFEMYLTEAREGIFSADVFDIDTFAMHHVVTEGFPPIRYRSPNAEFIHERFVPDDYSSLALFLLEMHADQNGKAKSSMEMHIVLQQRTVCFR